MILVAASLSVLKILLTPNRPAEMPVKTSLSAASSSNNACPKCSTIKKSGKLSCCARGGAWFKKCGDLGDKKFDHTWAEGIQACRGVVTSFLVQLPQQVMLRNVRFIVSSLNSTQSRNGTRQQTNIYRDGSMPNVGTSDSEDCAELAKVVVCISVLFVILHCGYSLPSLTDLRAEKSVIRDVNTDRRGSACPLCRSYRVCTT